MDYRNYINRIRVTRKLFTSLVSHLSEEQINHQSHPYKNTIGWNYAHVIATQQLLTYGLSGLPFHLPNDLITTYRKGTKPERPISAEEMQTIIGYATTSIDQLERDIENQVFSNFKPYETSFGVTLNSFEDAIAFIPVHEAMHLGMCMARRKTLP